MTQSYSFKDIDGRQCVLQLCHSYGAPFLDVARQYTGLFAGTDIAVTTVYLTGEADGQVARDSGGDEVIFLQYSSRQIRGLKRAAISALAAIVADRNISFAIAHRYKAIFIASHIAGLSVVGVHHAFGDYQRLTRRWYINRHRDMVALVGVSNAVRDNVRASLPRWRDQRIQTLYNRIDYGAMRSRLLSRETARRELGIAEEDFVFANVGRLHPDKDQASLVAAFAQVANELPQAQLLILGEGRLRSSLEQQIAVLNLGPRVRLLGQVTNAANYFRAFDSFILSSDHEPFGMVLLEAMAAGLPMAASDCGGASEVVGDSGILFPLGDRPALANAMTSLYRLSADERAQWRARMDERAVRLFSLEAGRQRFWSLPFVAQHFAAGVAHER